MDYTQFTIENSPNQHPAFHLYRLKGKLIMADGLYTVHEPNFVRCFVYMTINKIDNGGCGLTMLFVPVSGGGTAGAAGTSGSVRENSGGVAGASVQSSGYNYRGG